MLRLILSYVDQFFRWEKKTFAIDEDKLCMALSGIKGNGIFAKALIREDTLLGDFTGVVSRLDSSRNDEPNRLFFYLAICDHVIDPSEQRSAMRMVNNSHEPNARALDVHNGSYKVVHEAKGDIKPTEEMTVNNGWKFSQNNPVLYFTIHGNIIEGLITVVHLYFVVYLFKVASVSGTGQEEMDLEYQETFPNVLLSGSARVQMLFDVDVQPIPFNPSHEENHIFALWKKSLILLIGDN